VGPSSSGLQWSGLCISSDAGVGDGHYLGRTQHKAAQGKPSQAAAYMNQGFAANKMYPLPIATAAEDGVGALHTCLKGSSQERSVSMASRECEATTATSHQSRVHKEHTSTA